MTLTRRDTLRLAGGTLAATLIRSSRAGAATGAKISAIAFDAFPIFDPRPIFAQVEKFVPHAGKELGNLWRTRQFEYTWLRTVGGKYENFRKVTEDALNYAAQALKIELSPQEREIIMSGYLKLKAWPDVRPALDALKEAGLRLGFLSNFTADMLHGAIESAGLGGYFEQVLSTDATSKFKPDPDAYQLGITGFSLPREQILFVPFAGWDVAGAKWFGYETFWVNRLGVPPEALGVKADGVGKTLDDLVSYLRDRA